LKAATPGCRQDQEFAPQIFSGSRQRHHLAVQRLPTGPHQSGLQVRSTQIDPQERKFFHWSRRYCHRIAPQTFYCTSIDHLGILFSVIRRTTGDQLNHAERS
jgi:hypothetical protein